MHDDEVSGEVIDLAANPPADPLDVARTIVLRQLTAGPRSRAQLAESLARKQVPEAAATVVLDRMQEVGLVDDAAFAEVWVRSRHSSRGLSRSALARELDRKGVAAEDAEEALEQVDSDAEAQAAAALVAKRLPSLAGLDKPAQMRRLVGMLARRGYGPGLAARIVRDAIEASETLRP
jgi:regulatory protein